MKEALDGLQGVQDVQVDLTDDRFDVSYDSNLVSGDDLLAAIKKLDYEPAVVDSAPGGKGGLAQDIDTSKLPEDLAALFARARETGKPVLLRFSGAG